MTKIRVQLSPPQREFDENIISCLKEFLKDINECKWVGRENEAVNTFTLSYLLKKVKEGTTLNNPGQIGIEVAVPQINHESEIKKNKKQVRKDLVIWKKPMMTCFDNNKNPVNYPFAILEWKFKGFSKHQRNRDKQFESDVNWLKEYSERHGILGYAIMVIWTPEKHLLNAVRIFNGEVEEMKELNQ